MAEVNIPLIIGAAAVDAINPCAFGVLIFLLAYLTKTFKERGKILVNGLVYISAVFITYLLAGLLILPIIQQLGRFSVISYIVLAAIIIVAGLLEIKDYFWYGLGPSLMIFPKEAERIKVYVKRVSGKLSTAFFLGAFVALVELPCTGAVYLAVLSLMSLSGLTISNFTLLVLYNLIFILPLIVILFAVFKGASIKKLESWRLKHRGLMRLSLGLVLILLGIWMIIRVV